MIVTEAVPGAVDWTAVILAFIAILGTGGFGAGLWKVVNLLWTELVTKPREDLDTLRKQLEAKDNIVTTNALALDRVAETQERLVGLVGDMATAWESSQRESQLLGEDVRDLIEDVRRGRGGSGSGGAVNGLGPARRPQRSRAGPRPRSSSTSGGRKTGSPAAPTT